MIPTKRINEEGTEMWELPNGVYHREDGPAITLTTGTRGWYINGDLHREDGPAVTYSDVGLVWFLNNRSYTFDQYCSMLKSHHGKTDEDILLLRMQYA